MSSLIRFIMFCAFTLLSGGVVYAQFTDPDEFDPPFIIDHNEPHYEYRLQTGEALEIGPKSGIGYGSVLFETNPTGASVFINDIYQGKTPLLIDNVPDGSYDARLEMNGYLNNYLTFDVAARLQSHVTAGLTPRGKQFFDRRELYTTLMFEGSKVNAGGWGVGNSWGVYIKNINLEQTTMVHIGLLNTISFEGAIGYGYMFGTFYRFRITPQVGYAGQWFDDVATARHEWRGYMRGALNFKCAFHEQYAFSCSLLYDRTGPGFRAGVLFYVN